MNKKPNDKEASRLLTDTELELMTILWCLGEGTVNEVMAGLPRDRPLAYTSVSTILRILEQKGVVGTRKEGRSHVYIPQISREGYEATSVRHMVQHVFAGEPSALVRRLLGETRLRPEDLAAIKDLIQQAEDQS